MSTARSATDPPPTTPSLDILSSTGNAKMSGGNDSDPVQDAAALRAATEAIAAANGIATAMAKQVFEEKRARLLALMGAKSNSEKKLAEQTLCYYFAVHGTSPETQWSQYRHPVVFQGKSIQPMDVIGVIGQDSIKQFMARYSTMTMQMFSVSESFQAAMMERAVRAGLTAENSVFAIDFLGKDASLDFASVGKKSQAKNELLRYRSGNVGGIHEQKQQRRAADAGDRPPLQFAAPPSFSSPAART